MEGKNRVNKEENIDEVSPRVSSRGTSLDGTCRNADASDSLGFEVDYSEGRMARLAMKIAYQEGTPEELALAQEQLEAFYGKEELGLMDKIKQALKKAL